MTAAKARLWTGIGCIGSLVVVAGAMLATNAASSLMPGAPIHPALEFLAFAAFFASVAALILPFDVIGGIVIPDALEGRTSQPTRWAHGWARSVAVQVAFYSVTFFFYLQFGRAVGATAMIGIFALVLVSLLAGQEIIWRLMTANALEVTVGSTGFVKHFDDRFAGGVTGLPGLESILIPQRWKTALSPSLLHLLIRRRRFALKTGGRSRGVLLAMLWNVTCFAAAILAAGASVTAVADLVNIFFWFLLFSFVGLLVLPALNRMSVFALDRVTVAVEPPTDVMRLIRELDDVGRPELWAMLPVD